jgi:hypothetical protein
VTFELPAPRARCGICYDYLIRVTGKGWQHEQEVRHPKFIFGLLKKRGPHRPRLLRRVRV